MLLSCGTREDSWMSLGQQEINPVSPKGNQSWIFIGRTDAEAEAPILWPPDAKSWLIIKDPETGKDWGQEEKGATEDEMVGWHHWLGGHEFEQAPGIGDGQGSLRCCSPWGCKELYMTERLSWIDPIYTCWVEVALFFKRLIYLFYLWLCWVFVAACGLSPVMASGGYSLVAVCGLLIAVVSLIVEHRLQGAWAQ